MFALKNVLHVSRNPHKELQHPITFEKSHPIRLHFVEAGCLSILHFHGFIRYLNLMDLEKISVSTRASYVKQTDHVNGDVYTFVMSLHVSIATHTMTSLFS